MLTQGHSYKVAGVSQIRLDNWQAVLVRGKDTFGYNRLRKESLAEEFCTEEKLNRKTLLIETM